MDLFMHNRMRKKKDQHDLLTLDPINCIAICKKCLKTLTHEFWSSLCLCRQKCEKFKACIRHKGFLKDA